MTLSSRARVATALLAILLPREDVEAIIGDLEEEDASRNASSGSPLWYWAQIVRSIPSLLWLPVYRGGWRSTFGVALAAALIQSVIEVTTGFAVRALAPTGPLWPLVVALVLTLTSLALVSYMAARVRPGAATVLAGLAVLAIAVQQLLIAYLTGHVRLVQLAAFVVAPSTAFMGGVMSSKRHRR